MEIKSKKIPRQQLSELISPGGLVHGSCCPRLWLCDVEDLLPVGQGRNDFKCLGEFPAPVFGQHLKRQGYRPGHDIWAPTAGLRALSHDHEKVFPSLSISSKEAPSQVMRQDHPSTTLSTLLRRLSLRNSLGCSVTDTTQTADNPQKHLCRARMGTTSLRQSGHRGGGRGAQQLCPYLSDTPVNLQDAGIELGHGAARYLRQRRLHLRLFLRDLLHDDVRQRAPGASGKGTSQGPDWDETAAATAAAPAPSPTASSPQRRVLVHEHLDGLLVLGVHHHLPAILPAPSCRRRLLQRRPLLIILRVRAGHRRPCERRNAG